MFFLGKAAFTNSVWLTTQWWQALPNCQTRGPLLDFLFWAPGLTSHPDLLSQLLSCLLLTWQPLCGSVDSIHGRSSLSLTISEIKTPALARPSALEIFSPHKVISWLYSESWSQINHLSWLNHPSGNLFQVSVSGSLIGEFTKGLCCTGPNAGKD